MRMKNEAFSASSGFMQNTLSHCRSNYVTNCFRAAAFLSRQPFFEGTKEEK